MPVQLDFTAQLGQKEIFDFIMDYNTNFESTQPVENGYSFIEKKNVGTEYTSLFVQLKEIYNVIQGTIVVSNFEAIIPIEQPTTLTLKSNLFIIDTLKDEQLRAEIITAFISYNPALEIDVEDYINQKLSQEPRLSSNMFQVLSSFSLDKIGKKIEHRNQVNSVLALYGDLNGSGTISLTSGSKTVTGIGTFFKTELNPGSIIQSLQNVRLGIVDTIVSDTELKLKLNSVASDETIGFHIGVETEFYMVNETNLTNFLRRRGLRAVLSNQEYLEIPYNPTHDPIHEIESIDEADLSNIIIHDSAGLECEKLVIENIKVTKVLAYPEFKTEIVWRMVKIGCVKTLLPWFHKTQVRWTIITLYACIGHRRNLAPYILHRIVSCAEGSALSSAVIGIWFGNFASALVAFKALFVQCIETLVGEEINCIVPDLATMSEKGQWKDV
jgi:hypothetical protein